jgi:hypothetical protein
MVDARGSKHATLGSLNVYDAASQFSSRKADSAGRPMSAAARSAARCRRVPYYVECAAVRRRNQAYRPIGTNHQSAGPKGVEGNIQVRSNVLGLPVMAVSFGDQPREFAEYMRKCREPPNPCCPWLNVARLNRRLGHVIENKTKTGKSFHKIGGYGKMARVNQDVVGKIKLLKQRNATKEIGP